MSHNSQKPTKRALWLGVALAGGLLSVGTAQADTSGSVVPPPIFNQPLGASNALPAQVSPGNLLAPPAPPAEPTTVVAPPAQPEAAAASNPVHITKAGEVLNQNLVDMHMHPVTPGFVPHKPPVRQPEHRTWVPRHREATPETPTHSVPGMVLSNTQLNVLRFPTKIKHVWFPANTPIVGQPVYFAGDHAVMLQFEPGMDQSVQVMIELANGAVMNENARLQAGPGATINMGDQSPAFEGGSSGSTQAAEPVAPNTTGMAAVRLLQAVVQGRIPSGFVTEALPAPTPFQEFTAQPVMVWMNSDQDLRIYAFELVSKSKQAITITPPEFYRPGVEAVLLTSNVVGAGQNSFLYIVEATHGE